MKMVKSHEKKMSKLFSYDGVASEMSLKFEFWKDGYCTTGKIDGVWLMWRICKEYLKQNIITAMLKKQILIQLSFANW